MAAQMTEPDPFLMEFLGLFVNNLRKEVEDTTNLILGPVPVFRRKTVKREILQLVAIIEVSNRGTGTLYARGMSLEPG